MLLLGWDALLSDRFEKPATTSLTRLFHSFPVRPGRECMLVMLGRRYLYVRIMRIW